MRVALYTAIYGTYDVPKDVTSVDAPCLLYTDRPELEEPARLLGWQPKVMPLERLTSTAMLRAKFWKTNPWAACPEADITLWIDGSLTPLPHYVERCLAALGDDEVAFTPHPWRDCIYDELQASVGLPKYNAREMRAQCEHYRNGWGHPEHWGLFATGAITRRACPNVVTLGRHWWQHNRKWSWQDQLSLPPIVRDLDRVAGLRWNTNLPWGQWWGYTDHGVGVA